jgi:L-2-hydroxyglutarate oxidase LhgO
MTYSFDVVVVGAGVVGLACAKYLADAGLETLLVESESGFGRGNSSRNSEVIHAGIYYSKGSLKSRLCVHGKHLIYQYCAARGIPHQKIGKWIVSQTEDQAAKLEQLRIAGADNGVNDLHFLDSNAIRIGEPALKAREVLVSPSTGIVDSHSFMQSLENDILQAGGVVVYKTPCIGVAVKSSGFDVELGGGEPSVVSCRILINAAGVHAVELAARIDGLSRKFIPRACLAKGNYFSYTGKVPFNRLIYPVPETGGLGIHLTLDLNGQARFGPDVEWTDELDYQVNENLRYKFAQAIKTYWPSCQADRLTPAYSGIRPKLGTRQHFSSDFFMQSEQDHGVPGLMNLFGIESPGLTASLAIAEKVSLMLNN